MVTTAATAATAATNPWTNQPVLPNGAVMTALTMPVSRPPPPRCRRHGTSARRPAPGPAHGLGPPAALHDQGLDAHAQSDPDVDAGDDEQDQPADGGQSDQDADQQDRPQPVEAEAVALL